MIIDFEVAVDRVHGFCSCNTTRLMTCCFLFFSLPRVALAMYSIPTGKTRENFIRPGSSQHHGWIPKNQGQPTILHEMMWRVYRAVQESTDQKEKKSNGKTALSKRAANTRKTVVPRRDVRKEDQKNSRKEIHKRAWIKKRGGGGR